jgi:hypothetical protein
MAGTHRCTDLYPPVEDPDDLYNLKVTKDTLCFCPLCEKTHIRKLFWTGRGTPKKYCRHCEDLVPYIGDESGVAGKPATASATASYRPTN